MLGMAVGPRPGSAQLAPPPQPIAAAPQQASSSGRSVVSQSIPSSGFREDKLGFDMVFVKGGTFTMGCTEEQGGECGNNENPAHPVTLGNYYIGKYEVTQKLWRQVMVGTNRTVPSCYSGDDLPVEQISWTEIMEEFLPRLNEMTGKKYRLPTEAEWEYAARGGTGSKGYKYSGSNGVGIAGWYTSNSEGKTHPVGEKKANELGIYDMTGNVWEWCSDWLGAYGSGSQTNPKGQSSGSSRVSRGGNWRRNAKDCRNSNRDGDPPSYSGCGVGFRIAVSP